MSDAFDEYRRLLASLPTGIGGSVELLLSQMDEAAARRLRLCAIPHYIERDILDALDPALVAKEAEEFFGDLANLSFIRVVDHGCVMHDEVRRHLFDWWLKGPNIDEFRRASARLADYFKKSIAKLTGEAAIVAERQRIFHLIGADQAAGIAELESLCQKLRYRHLISEYEAIIKIVREYDSVLDHERKQWLAYHEAMLVSDLHRYDEAETRLKDLLQEPALPAALRTRTLYRLGVAFGEQHKWSQAIELYREARRRAETDPGAADQQLMIIHGLATACREAGEIRAAEDLLNKSLALAHSLGDSSAFATSYNSLGILYRKRGDTTKAIEAFKKSLQHLNREEDRFRQAQVYNNLGLIYADVSDWERARLHLQKSLDIVRQAGDTIGEAKTLVNLSRVNLNLGAYDQAVQDAERSSALFVELRHWFDAAVATRNLGRVFRHRGREAEARAAFARALNLFEHADAAMEVTETRGEIERLGSPRRLPRYFVITLILYGVLILILILIGIMAAVYLD